MRSRNCHFQSGEGGVRHPGAGVLMTAWFPRHTLTNGFQTLLECFAPFLQDPQVHTVYVIGSEARAGSPGAAAPPGLQRRRRRLQRPGQGCIMRPRSWPGRSGPRGSARVVPAGQVRGRRLPRRHRSPAPCLESWAVRPPELNPARSAAPRLRSSGCAFPGRRERGLRRFAGTGYPGSLWDRD